MSLAMVIAAANSSNVGGLLTLKPLSSFFRYDIAHKIRVNSLAVGLQQQGASSPASSHGLLRAVTDGRRKTLALASAIFVGGRRHPDH